ncbi:MULTISPECIES: CdaR family protein [unclassified Saccharicrinis]|uniref:CdaR family protein n=1 Tax=unclassified Saccharicrinis TaxID=2646859 RepID=UPI003D34AECE
MTTFVVIGLFFMMKHLKINIEEWKDKTKSSVKSLRQNRDLLAFLLFLILSTGLWFLNALRKEYTTTISYPVKYEDFPKDFILLGKPQNKLQLKIKSLGYGILPYHIGKILDPEPLNVSSFRRIRSGSKYGAYIPTREMLNDISNKLSNGVELIEIYPDTLYVFFEKKESKKVAVVFDSKLSFEQQFYQSGRITVIPDSVEVAGPASLVDSVDFIKTESKSYEGLKDSLVRNVALEQLNNIEVRPNRVVVNIPVEAFTQKNLRIPVDQLNIPDSLTLRSFPGDINLSFMVAASRFNDIKAQDFSAIIDFKQNTSTRLPDRLKVKLLDQPEGIKNVTYSPLFVECLFEKAKSDD